MAVFLLVFVWAIALFHGGATIAGWYGTHPWIDIPMHVAGGAWIACVYYYLVAIRHPSARPAHWAVMIVGGLGMVALIGVLWEFYELSLDVFVLRSYPPLRAPGWVHFDTLKDLLNDLAGGLITLTVLALRSRSSSR